LFFVWIVASVRRNIRAEVIEPAQSAELLLLLVVVVVVVLSACGQIRWTC